MDESRLTPNSPSDQSKIPEITSQSQHVAPRRPSLGQVFIDIKNSISKIFPASPSEIHEHTWKKTNLKVTTQELLHGFGVEEKVIKDAKSQSLSALINFIRENDRKMIPIVVDMVNKKGVKLFEEKLSNTDVQKQLLLHLGFNDKAVGLYNWGEEDEPEYRSPSDEDIHRLLLTVIEEMDVKDKIVSLIGDNFLKIGSFFASLEGERAILKHKGLTFNASKFYDKLGTLDKYQQETVMKVIAAAGKVIHKSIDKDTLYATEETRLSSKVFFVITKAGEIKTRASELGKGAAKYAYSVLKVDNCFVDHTKVILVSFETKTQHIEKKGDERSVNKLREERAILQELQGKSEYLAPDFDLFEVAEDTDEQIKYFIMQERMSGEIIEGEISKDKDGTSLVDKPPFAMLKAFSEAIIGLTVMHDTNMIHADFKPDNFMFDSKGRARVSDFGHTVKLEKDEEKVKGKLGTPGYMAPETATNRELSKLSDSYSFGASILATMGITIKAGSYKIVQLNSDMRGELAKPQDLTTTEGIKKALELIRKNIKETNQDIVDLYMLLGMVDIAEAVLKVNPSERLTSAQVQQQFKKLVGEVGKMLSKSENKEDQLKLEALDTIHWM